MPSELKEIMLGGPELISLVSLMVEIESSVLLDVFDPKATLHERPHGQQKLQTHMLEFGFECKKWVDFKLLSDLLKGFKIITGPSDPAKKFEYLLRLLSSGDFDWVLLNIDYHFKD
jgi:hypothetical protein